MWKYSKLIYTSFNLYIKKLNKINCGNDLRRPREIDGHSTKWDKVNENVTEFNSGKHG